MTGTFLPREEWHLGTWSQVTGVYTFFGSGMRAC